MTPKKLKKIERVKFHDVNIGDIFYENVFFSNNRLRKFYVVAKKYEDTAGRWITWVSCGASKNCNIFAYREWFLLSLTRQYKHVETFVDT